MRAIIHNDMVNIDPELKDRSPQSYRKRWKLEVQPVQSSIQDMRNAVSCVLPLLSHPSDEVVCEVLAFLKAMLYSGNRHVQEGFSIVLEMRDETLFRTIAHLFQNAGITFDERLAII